MENGQSERWKDAVKAKDVTAQVTGLKIYIRKEAWNWIKAWTNATTKEVSGLGLVHREGDVFTIYDAFLPKQTGTFGGTDLKPEGISSLMNDILKRGDNLADMRVWWHTHPTFDPFWSGIDVATAERLSGRNGEWQISIVLNQRGEYRCRLDIMKPIRIALDELDLYIWDDAEEDIKDKAEKMVKDNCEFEIPQPLVGEGYTWRNWDLTKRGKDQAEASATPPAITCTPSTPPETPSPKWATGASDFKIIKGTLLERDLSVTPYGWVLIKSKEGLTYENGWVENTDDGTVTWCEDAKELYDSLQSARSRR